MKSIYQKLPILVAIVFAITASKLNAVNPLNATKATVINKMIIDNQVADDANFRVTVLKNNAEINVHISLNATEGTTGTLNIYNPSGTLISKFDVELKQSPDFFNINLNEYSEGTYTFELTTGVGVHYTHPIL